MRFSISLVLRISLLLLLFFGVETACSLLAGKETMPPPQKSAPVAEAAPPQDSIRILVGTFLGSDFRNYYGDSIGDKLDVVWKTFLGKGTTIVNAERGVEEWFGAGWTGQPLVVQEKDRTFLIQGSFDHRLKKIDAETGEVAWNYEYDDILKGTGTIWINDSAPDPLNRIVILQGSRKGVQNSMHAPVASSFRAVSYFTGKELWRMNVAHTDSYSRDVDASALILRDTAYIGLENGKFVEFDPGKSVIADDTVNHPRVFSETPLYTAADHASHGGNLVTESSPVRIGGHIYIAAGSGHVYGYNLATHAIDWDFFIGSDIDGTPVVTADSCLLVAVEKQYIKGQGGVFKLDPRRDTSSCVEWYFPTGDFDFSSWKGGVIGSVSVNDRYNDGSFPHLAAFTGIDGNLHVVCYDELSTGATAEGPDGKKTYPLPVEQFTMRTGPSISTPVFAGNKLIAAGYNGIHLFRFDTAGNFSLTAKYPGIYEASPVADRGRVYIASRDGFLYCFGDTSKAVDFAMQDIPANVETKTAVVPEPSVIAAKKEPEKNYEPVADRAIASGAIPFLRERIAALPPVKAEPAAPVETVVAAAPKPKPVEKPVLTTIDRPGHYLVAGVFRSETNAANFLDLWKSRGMNAEVLLSPKGMFYVTIAHGKSEEELSAVKLQVKQEFAVDAWVFVK